MTTSKENRFEITAGPAREDLFDGLRLRHENRRLVFIINVPMGQESVDISRGWYTLNIQVDGIAVEDGSGSKWIVDLRDPTSTFGSTKLHGYFNTSTRKGWVEPVLK